MRHSVSCLAALLLAGCASVPASIADTPSAPGVPIAPLAASITSELPRNARPTHYAITVTPDPAALTFSGSSAVDLSLLEPGRTITLNAADLVISKATLMSTAGGEAIPLTVALDQENERATFTAPVDLVAGQYRLATEYSGIINQQPSGLFALDYPDKRTGKQARALFTQFESPDAREFAPVFDEPAYKATFDLSAIVPATQMAVSNMPVAREQKLGNGTKRVTFATSPKMSTYLLFFAVGDFERLAKRSPDGTEVGIVSPAGSGEQARYALDALAQLLPFYKDYFGVGFPLPKLDNVAAPGQSQTFGAMENWGSILTFERSLLLDPKTTSPTALQYLYSAQAHETAHQWFGDLVTMAWWNDLWLNEGFASWMETKATDHFHPDWHALIGRVNGRERAMSLDSLSSSHAVVVPMPTVAVADQSFDAISYSKGEAVIAMLEAYAGENVWREGIRRYMATHAYGSAVTADLWRAQEQVGVRDIARIADSFTLQPGIPLVLATQRCEGGQTRLTLQQSEYSRDRKDAAAKQPRRWLVPLTVRAADGSVQRQVLDGKAEMTLPGCGPVVVNGGQLGYFRTQYAAAEIDRLAGSLATLPPIDQLGLVSDNLALAAAGYQAYAPALALLSAVPSDANPVVAEAAISSWADLYSKVDKGPESLKLAKLAHDAWFGRLQRLTFDPKPGESVADTDLRASLVDKLGQMGDPAVVAEAKRRFAALKSDRSALDGPLKATWLGIAARAATPADWEALRTFAKTSPTAVERSLFYSQLGSAIDDGLAQRSLDLTLTDEVPATDRAAILVSVARHHPDLAYDFAVAKQAKVEALVDDYSRANLIPRLAGTSTQTEMIAKLEKLRASRPETKRKGANEALASLRQRLEATPRIRQQIAAWLAATRA